MVERIARCLVFLDKIPMDSNDEILRDLTLLFNDGWVVDPDLKIIRLDNAVIYHLIKYAEGEEPVEEDEGAVLVIEVKIDDTPDRLLPFIEKGWRVKSFYSGKVQLVKPVEVKPVEDEKDE